MEKTDTLEIRKYRTKKSLDVVKFANMYTRNEKIIFLFQNTKEVCTKKKSVAFKM